MVEYLKVKFLKAQLIGHVLYNEGEVTRLDKVMANNLSKAKIVKLIKEK